MTPDIHDISSPEEFLLREAPLWQSAWFWSLLMIGSVIVWLIIRRVGKAKTSAELRQELLEDATTALIALKTKVDSMSPQASAVHISLIIRQYLEAAFQDPALFETNEELTLRPEALEQLHPQCRTAVMDHLGELSQLKYVASSQQDHITELIDQTIELLKITEPAPFQPEHSAAD